MLFISAKVAEVLKPSSLGLNYSTVPFNHKQRLSYQLASPIGSWMQKINTAFYEETLTAKFHILKNSWS